MSKMSHSRLLIFFKCKILFSSLLSLLFKYKVVESFWKVGLPQCLSPGLTTWIQSQEKIHSPDQTNQGTQPKSQKRSLGASLDDGLFFFLGPKVGSQLYARFGWRRK